RRPEVIIPFRNRRDERLSSGGQDPNHHFSGLDVLAMIVAALQIVLPLALVILAATAAAYGLFMLYFGN
ncbi:MAG: hypothetical protein ACLFM6_10060, partial [Spirochaetaceae bacterium]